MNIQLLKTFLEVARTRHFGRAADKVCLTQSAVSARIKLLEENLGTRLFERKRNDIELTAAGRRLAIAAEQIVKQWENTKNALNLIRDDEQTVLRLGSVFDLWSLLLQPWIVALRQQQPELILQVQALSATLLGERLLSDDLDIIIVYDPPYQASIETCEVGAVDLLLVSTEPVQLSDHKKPDYVFVDWGVSYSGQHQQLLGDKLTPAISFNIASMARDYLLSQGGMAYLAASQVKDLIQAHQLYVVADAPRFDRTLYGAIRRNHNQADLLWHVLESLKAITSSDALAMGLRINENNAS